MLFFKKLFSETQDKIPLKWILEQWTLFVGEFSGLIKVELGCEI
ncbi:hypothetical protein X474_04565 [Dethiosulfatarculus sandiegensis]|uniref:Uncharacterized protein n=1 Tax=Dethiosulfatarculus sandiegensis TaxID=1429043 RepID=A0A0D2K0B7_9BACT|nr:hypothetical protein X474_04565 [Dethiosulfatarculus sandiegensis]